VVDQVINDQPFCFLSVCVASSRFYEDDGQQIKIEKFTRNNSFSLWRIKMQALLKEYGIWASLSG